MPWQKNGLNMIFKQSFIWHLLFYKFFCETVPFVDILQSLNFTVIFMLWQKGVENDPKNNDNDKSGLEKYSKGVIFVACNHRWQYILDKLAQNFTLSSWEIWFSIYMKT